MLIFVQGTFPFDTTAEDAHPEITHDLESYVYLIWLIGVNFKGPCHNIVDWPPPPKRRPIPDNSMSLVEATQLLSAKFGTPPVKWAQDMNELPTTVLRSGKSHVQPAEVDEKAKEEKKRNVQVPDWAEMGTINLQTDDVQLRKTSLHYNMFKASLHPYWKVGTLKDGWNNLYNLLWPTKEDFRPMEEKCASLTHAQLIAVLRGMIYAIPATDDSAPSWEVVQTVCDKYSKSIKCLVELDPYRFQTPMMPPPQALPLLSPHPPALSSSPTSFGFVNYNNPQPALQKHCSNTSSGRLVAPAASHPLSIFDVGLLETQKKHNKPTTLLFSGTFA